MAANLTIATASDQQPYPYSNGLIAEDVTITGAASANDDTGTYTTKYVRQPLRFIGAFSYSFSGQVMTLTDKQGIGTTVQSGTVVGYP